MTVWYEGPFDKQVTDGEIIVHVRVPVNSPWFDGHFPDAPVLPGVAQLGMVHDLLCRMMDQPLPVTQVSRVRFKQMIHPGQDLILTVKTGDKNSSHSFRISGDEGLICSGLIRLSGRRQ